MMPVTPKPGTPQPTTPATATSKSSAPAKPAGPPTFKPDAASQAAADKAHKAIQGGVHIDPHTGTPVVQPPVSSASYEKGNYRSLVVRENLDNQAWFENENLITGNPHLREIATPITFSINLTEFDSSTALSPGLQGGTPVELRLNCSLSRFNLTMKHIVNKSNTRTGFHLTFWGMEPDVISGSGSTGVFMNYFGVTSLMSLEDTPDDLKTKINSLYTSPSKNTSVQFEPGTAAELTSDGGMRVAAQDAFIELLALFRNNGLIRYDNPNLFNDSNLDLEREQHNQNTYSEKYGDSTYTRMARKNDIMVKGNVDFHYKNNLYQGYFKSLSWMLDSENPFQWQFDFIFQVQKTFSQVYYTKG